MTVKYMFSFHFETDQHGERDGGFMFPEGFVPHVHEVGEGLAYRANNGTAQAGEIAQVQTQYYPFAQEQMQIMTRFVLKG